MHSKSTVSFEGSHLNYSRVSAVARGEEDKKRQRREEYLDRLMQEKVGERTGVRMQLGRKAEVERTKSTELVTEKVYGPEDAGQKQRWEHAGMYGQNPDAQMRNHDSFNATQKRDGSSFSRPHLPKIHKGRLVGKHFQLDGIDGAPSGDPDDSYAMRGVHNPAVRANAGLSSFVASPPPLIAGGIGTYDTASRNQPSTQKGALQRVIGQKRSPDSFFKQTARDNISTLKTKLLLDQPPYPRTYKQLPAKKGLLGEGGIGLVDSSSPAGASSSKPASPSHRSFARTDREIGVPSDLFGIQVDAKHAAQLGYGTEKAAEERFEAARERPDSALKMERKQTHARHVTEKARLMEEVRQNRERAIEHAQMKKEAQLRRKQRGEAGALNFSMRFEASKDMAKFERHVEDVFAKKKARKHNRNAMSIDFGGVSADLKLDLQKRGFNDSQQKQSDLDGLGPRERGNRGSQLNIFNQSSLLPRIDVADAQGSLRGASIAESSRRRQFAISSIDGSTMISRRERKFKYSNVKDKLKAFDFLAQSKENAGTFLLRSHHYKYNRIKEGGWGAGNSSSASSRGDRKRKKATTLAAEVLAAGSDGSRGSKLGAKDLPLLLNSSSNLDDLWSNDQLPKLNAAQAAEVNRLIKLENQRSSIAQSTQNHHDAKGSQQPGATSTLPASRRQKSPRDIGESKLGLEAEAAQTQGSPQGKLRLQDAPYQAALEGGRRPIAAAAPSGREQSKTTLMTDYSLPKGRQPQMNQRDRQTHRSPLGKEERPRRQHGSPDLVSAQTKVPDHGSEQADPTGMGLHTDFSVDAATRRKQLDATRLHLSYDQGALQALHTSSVNIQDPHRSQVFAMRAAITATETPRVGQTTEMKAGPSQLSTAAYPFVTHHGIRKAAPKTNLSHEQSKMTTSIHDSAGNFRSRPKPGMSVIERSQAHFRRVRQQLREQFDRQAFNVSYQVTDRSMSLLRGTRGLMPAPSATTNSLEQHATARRAREKLESQLAQLQQQIRDRKKQIKQLKLDKVAQSQKFEDQVEINSRLDSLVVERETHDMPGEQVSATPPLPMDGYPSDFALNDARLDVLAQGLHGARMGHSGSSQPVMNSYAHPTGQSSTLGIPPPSQPPGLHQIPSTMGSASAPASSPLQQHLPTDPSIHDFYQHLFSADLKSSRDRAHLQLQAHGQWLQSYAQELAALLQENEVARNMIRRYQRMIREVKEGNEGLEPREQSGQLVLAAELKKRAEMSDVLKSVESLDLKAIAGELYRYGDSGQVDQQTQSKSETAGVAQLTVHTPLTTAHQRTQMSFMGKSRANAGQVVDKRKIDGSIILMNRVYKEAKALDSIVAHLAQLKTIFKAEKLSLFVIAPELQLNLFRNPKERRQNYRKIFVNGGTTSMSEQAVYALYASEEDYCTPVFRDLDEAACHMFSNRVILIPMKALGRVRMSLQIVGSAETKASKARGRTSIGRKTTSGFEGPSFGRVTERDAASRGGASAQLRKGQGSSLSDARPRSLSGAAHSQRSAGSRMRKTKRTPVAVGWTRNDFCLLKILTNYLAMNVDYYEQKVLQRAKEKKIDEIIDFAQDIMSVKTYRQLVKKVREYRQTVLGFEECALFFEDTETGDLFTLTDLEAGREQAATATKQSKARTSTAFAKELLFPEDSVVVFPSTIGMTGEVHQRVGIRFRNGVGLASTQQQEVLDDAQSQKTAPSFTSTKRNLLPGQQLSRTQATQLERIKEGNPQAENEAEVNSEQMRQSGYSGREFNPFRAGAEPVTANRRASVERHGAGATGAFEDKTPTARDFQRTTGARHESPLVRAGWETKRHLDQSPMRRPTALELLDGDNQKTAYGVTQRASPMLERRTFADQIGASAASQPGRESEPVFNVGSALPRKHPLRGSKGPGAGQKKDSGQVAAPRYYADFLPDIDNFLGVKDLDNFVISSIRDDGYALGDKSVGVLHLFNKLDKSRINRDDLARIEQFSRLVGALAQKAHGITSSLTLIIGLSQNIQAPSQSLGQLTAAAGMGDFDQVTAPMDALRKQIGFEETTRRDQETQILAELTKGARTAGAGMSRRY